MADTDAADVAWLQRQRVPDLLNELMTDLLSDRPTDPVAHIRAWLAARQAGGSGISGLSTHTVPPTRSSPSESLPLLRPPGSLGGTAVAYDPVMALHVGDPNRPERPERIGSIWDRWQTMGILEPCRRYSCREASMTELEAVHSAQHVELTLATAGGEPYPDAPHDVYFCSASASAARTAAGTLIDLTLAVLRGEVANAFAVIRPPGHHCTPDRPMGFCLFNNVAVAVRAAQAHGAQRVLVVDWDIHHGNGTQAAFTGDPSVLFFSVHAHFGGRFYPGSGAPTEVGEGEGKGFTINLGWNSHKNGDADYIHAFERLLLPIATRFAPDLVLVSCGFDAGLGDPLGKNCVTPEGFAHLLRLLLPLAGGRIILALEGGYNLSTIMYSSEACLRTLLGLPVDDVEEPSAVKDSTRQLVQEARDIQSSFWPGLAGDDG
eukprot:GGOE01002463.1.p1 GENE.GGOE01002463.1~~GGOE01002463.1.p1  ORF type:complete len:444 (-),score=79.29 GGOE01002463.1:258-1556(-)